MNNTVSLALKEKLAFGMGAFGKDFVYIFISMYLLYFYTDVLQIPATTAGAILLIVRLVDALFDLPFGFLVDKTRTRWGKLRPYLLFGAVPYGACAAFLFYAPAFSQSGKIFYAFTLYLLISILYSIVSIPHAALNTVMTDNIQERAHLSKYLVMFSGIAAAVAGVITVPIVSLFPNEKSGYFFMGASLGMLAIIFILLCFRGTTEQVTNTDNKSVPLRLALKTVMTNIPFLILCASFLLAQLSLGIRSAAGIYYFIYNVGNANLFSIVSGIGGIIGLVLTFLSPLLALRIGMKKYYILVGAFTVIDFLLIYFTPVSNIPLVLTLNIMAGTLTGLTMFAGWGMLPDAISYSIKRNGLHIEGVYYSLYNFIQKLGTSLAGGLAGFVLAAYGYQTGNAPTPQSLEGILVTSALIPAACALLFSILMVFYNSNKAEAINSQIEGDRSNVL
ncbi:MFS transporter [Niallia sp. MER 6]|uniref:MFS transporter n=1 Tax=Niallia sp. MER 6 TaxID=2939567 RepID=UPI00203C9E56|nr:glycoside-pentoside-hexuronide (GPH):cation symporter [Niallia sp. MER 6]MCM3033133.1 glycoside-pentoside-hexuronide (GPH):cation symporter [Niallia sp. MER 6]